MVPIVLLMFGHRIQQVGGVLPLLLAPLVLLRESHIQVEPLEAHPRVAQSEKQRQEALCSLVTLHTIGQRQPHTSAVNDGQQQEVKYGHFENVGKL
jgi:hypothetical protein